MMVAPEAMIAPRFPLPVSDARLRGTTMPMDHRRAPLAEALARYRDADTVSFSTPGHKQGSGVDPTLRALLGSDVFAADIWLNTGEQDAILREAEALGADAWGAERAFYLGNGSSSGNHAFLLAMLAPGDEVIVARNAHTSFLVALILTGARPVYVTPRLHADLNIGLGVAPDDVAAALDTHPAVKLVAVVSPTYCGIASDLGGIVDVAHARGVPVYVDEAWGPHLPFHPALPAAAMASGADGAVTSSHKLLSSLSQGAILLEQGPRVDAPRLATSVRMMQTTSRLLPILASIDTCRRQMVLDGVALLDRAIELAWIAGRRLRELPGIDILDAERLGPDAHGFDVTRLVIDVHGLGVTGFEVERVLRERFAIAPEMSDLVSVVCLVTIGDTSASVGRLVAAFSQITKEYWPVGASAGVAFRSTGTVISPGRQVMSPREAYFARRRDVPLCDAVGEVAAELVVPYPPGMPVLAPGEEICAAKVEYLQVGAALGMSFCGAADPRLGTVRVVGE